MTFEAGFSEIITNFGILFSFFVELCIWPQQRAGAIGKRSSQEVTPRTIHRHREGINNTMFTFLKVD